MPGRQSKLGNVEEAVRTALDTKKVPVELQDALWQSVQEMLQNYAASQIRPSELNAGDFSEASVRILQFLSDGNYTPLDKALPPMNNFLQNMEASSTDDTLRIHIPRVLQMIYDVRNRRGVGHLPGSISSNKPDAELLIISVRWILAQFIRLFHSVDHDEAQRIVDILCIKDSPIVQDFEGTKRIITRNPVTIPDQILIFLLSCESNTMVMKDLSGWVRGNKSSIGIALKRLDERNLIHIFPDRRITLTSAGYKYAKEIVFRYDTK